MFHYASGGFIGASPATFGDLFASLAEIHGSLLASGGAVLGSPVGTEVKLDGPAGKYRMRYDGQEINMLGHGVKRISFGGATSEGRLSGTWVADSPMSVRGQTAALKLEALKNGTNASVTYDGVLNVKAAGKNLITASPDTSTLHGKWVASEVITVSDRRLKTGIRPLSRALSAKVQGDREDEARSPVWVLRQLRPVSFRFRQRDSKTAGAARGPNEPPWDDSGRERYGFVTQELQEVVPSAVHDIGSGRL